MPAHEPGASPVLVLTPEGGPVITGAASDTAVYDPVDTLCATHPGGAVGLSAQLAGTPAPLVREAARALARFNGSTGTAPRGGVAVTTIGYLSRGQAELAASTGRTVVSSPLLAVPTLLAMLPAGRTVLVVYADAGLADPHADLPGVPADRLGDVEVIGMEGPGPFRRAVLDRTEEFDHPAVARQIIAAIERPRLGAVVLECGEMAAVADEVRAAVTVPVVDYHALVGLVLEATGHRRR
jgi:hypothetical protein